MTIWYQTSNHGIDPFFHKLLTGSLRAIRSRPLVMSQGSIVACSLFFVRQVLGYIMLFYQKSKNCLIKNMISNNCVTFIITSPSRSTISYGRLAFSAFSTGSSLRSPITRLTSVRMKISHKNGAEIIHRTLGSLGIHTGRGLRITRLDL